MEADLQIGPTFLRKVDLAYAYMRVWFCLEDIPSVVFLIPKENKEEEQLVDFYLSILMGYV